MQLGTCNIGPEVSGKGLEKVSLECLDDSLIRSVQGSLKKGSVRSFTRFLGKDYEINPQVSVIRLDEVITGVLGNGLMRSVRLKHRLLRSFL